jgi:VWFA-related protein
VLFVRAQVSAPPAEDATPTIKVDVAVVNVLCSVRDGNGRLMANLNKTDFEIREDNKPQAILYFNQETNLPLTLGLLVDSSISQQALIESEQRAASLFFEHVLGPRDAAFLISFDVTVDLLRDVTGSVDLLQDSLEDIRVRAPAPTGGNTGPFPPLSIGGTHLYDAVYLAANDVLQREAGRKAVILITDGQDQGSRLSRDEAIEAAQRNDVIIYGILFVDRQFYGYGGGFYSGEDTLKKMAEETGGRMFRAANNRELSASFDQISEELRSQYSIGYSPTNTARDGSYRRLDVRVRGRGLRVQARRGYYAPQDSYPARR